MSRGSLAAKRGSAKNRNAEKLVALEAEVTTLRNDLAALRNTYNCHTHYPAQPLWSAPRQPIWYWNGHQYVWG